MKESLRRLKIFLLMVVLIGATAVGFSKETQAATALPSKDGIFYDFNDGVLTLSGTGELPDWKENAIRAYVNPKVNIITKIVIDGNVESVGSWNFKGFSDVTEVVIGKNVKSIGYEAFKNCTALEKVTLNAGLEEVRDCAFVGCPNLKEVIIPETVTSVGAYAFHCYTSGLSGTDTEKDTYMYKAYDTEFMVYGYVNTAAERYAAEAEYNVSFGVLGAIYPNVKLS